MVRRNIVTDAPSVPANRRRKPLSVPFELSAGKPYVSVSVNGQGPFSFLLDNGSAVNVLDTRVAEALAVELIGSERQRGGGAKSVASATGKDVIFSVGQISLPTQDVVVMPLADTLFPGEGREVHGLLGYGFFNSHVVELDYAAGWVRVWPAGSAGVDLGPSDGLPLHVEWEHAYVDATLLLPDGRNVEGRFMVDSAWRSALSLTTPFTNLNRLLQSVTTVSAVTGVGIGGPTRDEVGRVMAVQLGPFQIDGPVVSLSQSRRGVLSDDVLAGILGGEILRRFTVVFDYAGGWLGLAKNDSYAEPYELDLAGLFLTADREQRDRFHVADAIRGGAAYDAGVRVGDRVLAVDGQPVAELGLERVRQSFRSGLGQQRVLLTERRRKLIERRMELRRVL